MTDYKDIKRDTPFVIARKNKKGELIDWSKFQIDSEDEVLRVWFRHEKFWINAPDNRTHNKWVRAIEKWGVQYE